MKEKMTIEYVEGEFWLLCQFSKDAACEHFGPYKTLADVYQRILTQAARRRGNKIPQILRDIEAL